MALEVKIGADNSDFQKKIKEVEFDIKELSNLKLERIKLGLDTKGLDLNIKDAKKTLSSLNSTLKDTGTSFNNLQKPVANGGNTLMQFSRIAQDAPFGIMGIGNNITATAEAFSYLSKSSGGAGNALKAVASSMLGTGGILLAVSLVTSALTYMSQNGITVGDVFSKLSGTFNEFANSIKKANEEAAKSASSEIATMNALVSVAQNKTLADENRFIAVEKLQKQYVVTFGNLSKEKILNGDLEIAIKKTTNAIIAQSRAKAYTSKLDDLSVEQLKTYTEMQDVLGNLANKYKVGAKDLIGFQNAMKKGTESADKFLRTIHKNDRGQLSAMDLLGLGDIDNYINLWKEAGIQNGKAYRLGLNIAAETGVGIILDAPAPTKKEKVKKPVKPANIKGGVIGFTSELDSSGLVDVNSIKVFTGEFDKFGDKIKDFPGQIKTSMGEIRQTFDSELLASLEILYDFNNDVNALVKDSLAGTFANLGSSIGDALANGTSVIGAIGTTLIQSLGSFISDLGGMLIKYGTLAVLKGKLDLAILSGGQVSIAAGIAAIGVGVALKAAGSAIGKAAQSGGSKSSGNVSTGGNYSSPASGSFASSNSVTGGGTVVFQISGQSLIGVLSNTLDKNTRLGGNLAI